RMVRHYHCFNRIAFVTVKLRARLRKKWETIWRTPSAGDGLRGASRTHAAGCSSTRQYEVGAFPEDRQRNHKNGRHRRAYNEDPVPSSLPATSLLGHRNNKRSNRVGNHSLRVITAGS